MRSVASELSNRMPAFDAHHRRDLARGHRPLDVGRGAGEREHGRVPSHHLVDRIHLLERGADGGVALQQSTGT